MKNKSIGVVISALFLVSCSTASSMPTRTTQASVKIKRIEVRKVSKTLPNGPYGCERIYYYTDNTRFVEKYKSSSPSCR